MTPTAEIYAVAVATAGGFVYGFFFANICMIGFWPKARVERFLRKRVEYKPKLQNTLISITVLLGIVLAMINLLLVFLSLDLDITLKIATFMFDIDGVITDSEKVPRGIALGVGVIWSVIRYHKRDTIQKSLDKKDETLPTIVETARDSEAFQKTCKAKEVAKLLYKFEKVGFDYYVDVSLVKKYHFDTYKPPFVVFLNKDGSRVSIDGKDVFQAEEITSPERYASLLQKVLEKFSSESA